MKIILFGSEGVIGTEVKKYLVKINSEIYLIENKLKLRKIKNIKLLRKVFFKKILLMRMIY